MDVPYSLSLPQDQQPSGEFLLPVCTSRERLQELLNALKVAEIYGGIEYPTAKWDVLEALAFLDNPKDAPCFPSDSEEDTILDDLFQLADGVITSFQEGGVVEALGYLIQETGTIVLNTVKKVVSITVLGLGVACLVSVFVGGIPYGVVSVGVGEAIETIIALPDNPTNIINFVFDKVA